MSKSILVVGATGNYGQFVVHALSKAGFDVRVFTRKREKAIKFFGEQFPIFEGDIENDATLRPALAGCQGVHVNLRGWVKFGNHDRLEHLGTANVARLAREAGVERITYLSCIHAREEYAFMPHLKAKLDAEKAIRASGLGYAVFACCFFMEGCHHLQKGKTVGVVPLRRPFHYVAADDYAAMVVKADQAPAAPNRRFDVYGPEAIDAHELTERFLRSVRPDTKIISVPLWASVVYHHLIGHKNRQYQTRVIRLYRKHGEPGDPSQADTSLGRPTTTFQQWCEAQRPAAV